MEYDKWLESIEIKNIDESVLKERVKKEIAFFSSLTVQEYILYKKWNKMKEKYAPTDISGFFEDDRLNKIKNNIWIPSHPDDYMKLEPVVIPVSPSLEEYKLLSDHISTGLNPSRIGRQCYFMVNDGVTGNYLGLIGISSDFMDLGPRDKYIGWDKKAKVEGRMINHIAIGFKIVPTQPFGYAYTGGKLLALLVLCDEIENHWNNKYKDKIVGYTTTSLFGSFSQYQNLQYWTRRGHSSGSSVNYVISKETEKMMYEWLKAKYPEDYYRLLVPKEKDSGKTSMPSNHRQRALGHIYNKLGLENKKYVTYYERGIYFAKLFENTNEFLRKEIQEKDLKRRFDNSKNALVNIWKDRYAGKRVKSLLEQNKYNTDCLFYDDLALMSDWDEVRAKYLGDIGR